MNNPNPEPVEPAMLARIVDKLQSLAAAEGVRVLFAAESGSRAWGFGSPDSDYDVRFIYARDIAWYLRLEAGRDVCEGGIDENLIDLSGWDVDKTLRLLIRSNPALYEWLVSPVVYLDDGQFAPAARAIFAAEADRAALAHHYLSIATGQWKREVAGKPDVRLKKYFYVVRPLLALQWVLEHASPPPMDIDTLIAASGLPGDVSRALAELIERKRQTPEFGKGPRIAVLDRWCEARLASVITLERDAHRTERRMQKAQALFHTTIGLGEGHPE